MPTQAVGTNYGKWKLLVVLEYEKLYIIMVVKPGHLLEEIR